MRDPFDERIGSHIPSHVFGRLCRLATVAGHTYDTYCIAADSAGRCVVTGSDDAYIRVWSASTGRLQVTLRGFQQHISHLAFSHDNACLAATSVDSGPETVIRVWALAHGGPAACGQQMGVLHGHTGEVNEVAWDPLLGGVLVSASDDGCLRVWEVPAPDGGASGGGFGRISAEEATMMPAAASAGLLDELEEDEIVVVPTRHSVGNRRDASAGSASGAAAATSSADPRAAAVAASNITVESSSCCVVHLGLLAPRHGQSAGAAESPAPASNSPSGKVICLAMRPTGCVVATGSDDGALRFVEIARPHASLHSTADRGAGGPAAAPPSELLTDAAVRSRFSLLAQPRVLASVVAHAGAEVTTVAFNRRGDAVLTTSMEAGEASVWRWTRGWTDVTNLRLAVAATAEAGVGSSRGSGGEQPPQQRSPLVDVTSACWSCDGRIAFVAVVNRKPDGTQATLSPMVTSASSSTRTAAATVTLQQAAQQRGAWPLHGASRYATRPCASETNSAHARNAHVQVWDVASGRCLRILRGHSNLSFVIAAHPSDPRLLLTTGLDGRVMVHDAHSGVTLARWTLFRSVDATGGTPQPPQQLQQEQAEQPTLASADGGRRLGSDESPFSLLSPPQGAWEGGAVGDDEAAAAPPSPSHARNAASMPARDAKWEHVGVWDAAWLTTAASDGSSSSRHHAGLGFVVTDSDGRLHFFGLAGTPTAVALADAPYEQRLTGDAAPLVTDATGYITDHHTQQPPHLFAPHQELVNAAGEPYPPRDQGLRCSLPHVPVFEPEPSRAARRAALVQLAAAVDESLPTSRHELLRLCLRDQPGGSSLRLGGSAAASKTAPGLAARLASSAAAPLKSAAGAGLQQPAAAGAAARGASRWAAYDRTVYIPESGGYVQLDDDAFEAYIEAQHRERKEAKRARNERAKARAQGKGGASAYEYDMSDGGGSSSSSEGSIDSDEHDFAAGGSAAAADGARRRSRRSTPTRPAPIGTRTLAARGGRAPLAEVDSDEQRMGMYDFDDSGDDNYQPGGAGRGSSGRGSARGARAQSGAPPPRLARAHRAFPGAGRTLREPNPAASSAAADAGAAASTPALAARSPPRFSEVVARPASDATRSAVEPLEEGAFDEEGRPADALVRLHHLPTPARGGEGEPSSGASAGGAPPAAEAPRDLLAPPAAPPPSLLCAFCSRPDETLVDEPASSMAVGTDALSGVEGRLLPLAVRLDARRAVLVHANCAALAPGANFLSAADEAEADAVAAAGPVPIGGPILRLGGMFAGPAPAAAPSQPPPPRLPPPSADASVLQPSAASAAASASDGPMAPLSPAEVRAALGGRWFGLTREIRRGRTYKCALKSCGRVGATLGCSEPTCHRSYHIRCAIISGWDGWRGMPNAGVLEGGDPAALRAAARSTTRSGNAAAATSTPFAPFVCRQHGGPAPSALVAACHPLCGIPSRRGGTSALASAAAAPLATTSQPAAPSAAAAPRRARVPAVEDDVSAMGAGADELDDASEPSDSDDDDDDGSDDDATRGRSRRRRRTRSASAAAAAAAADGSSARRLLREGRRTRALGAHKRVHYREADTSDDEEAARGDGEALVEARRPLQPRPAPRRSADCDAAVTPASSAWLATAPAAGPVNAQVLYRRSTIVWHRRWLSGTRPHPGTYCPQVGDEVVYVPQGHEPFASEHKLPFPAADWPRSASAVLCTVDSVQHRFPRASEEPAASVPGAPSPGVFIVADVALRVAGVQLGAGASGPAWGEPRSSRHAAAGGGGALCVGGVFVLSWHPACPEFLVLRRRYEAALRRVHGVLQPALRAPAASPPPAAAALTCAVCYVEGQVGDFDEALAYADGGSECQEEAGLDAGPAAAALATAAQALPSPPTEDMWDPRYGHGVWCEEPASADSASAGGACAGGAVGIAAADAAAAAAPSTSSSSQSALAAAATAAHDDAAPDAVGQPPQLPPWLQSAALQPGAQPRHHLRSAACSEAVRLFMRYYRSTPVACLSFATSRPPGGGRAASSSAGSQWLDSPWESVVLRDWPVDEAGNDVDPRAAAAAPPPRAQAAQRAVRATRARPAPEGGAAAAASVGDEAPELQAGCAEARVSPWEVELVAPAGGHGASLGDDVHWLPGAALAAPWAELAFATRFDREPGLPPRVARTLIDGLRRLLAVDSAAGGGARGDDDDEEKEGPGGGGGGGGGGALFAAFLQPVAGSYRDYHCLVALPMDLGTVLARLLRGWYRTLAAVAADLRLVCANCLVYNDPASPLAGAARQLAARLRALLDEVEPGGPRQAQAAPV